MSKILPLFAIVALALVALFVAASEGGSVHLAEKKNVGTNYDFSLSTAFRSLKYAKIAYCPSSNIKDWSCAACPLHPNFQVYNVYDNSSVSSQAYTGYDPTTNEVVVAFRGSYNIPNWINDLDAVHVDYPYCSGCEVHKGFWAEWQSYQVPIIADVQRLMSQHSGASIFVSGHSLGAAVAVHAVATFNRLRLASTITEYSFGTPRTGNTAFSEWVAMIARTSYGKTQRIVNKKDPVPHLPLKIMNYLHTPHETWAKEGGTSPLINCNDYPGHEDPDCSDSIIIPDVEDHLHYLGMHTECEMTESDKKAEKKFSPELKQKLYKMFRQDKIARMNKKN